MMADNEDLSQEKTEKLLQFQVDYRNRVGYQENRSVVELLKKLIPTVQNKNLITLVTASLERMMTR